MVSVTIRGEGFLRLSIVARCIARPPPSTINLIVESRRQDMCSERNGDCFGAARSPVQPTQESGDAGGPVAHALESCVVRTGRRARDAGPRKKGSPRRIPGPEHRSAFSAGERRVRGHLKIWVLGQGLLYFCDDTRELSLCLYLHTLIPSSMYVGSIIELRVLENLSLYKFK